MAPLTDRELTVQSKAGRRTFSSPVLATAVLSAVAADLALPSVAVPAGAIPGSSTVARVIAGIGWRTQGDSSGADNAVNGAQQVQVRNAAGGAFVNAIDVPDNTLFTPASSTQGGPFWLGETDVKAQVPGPGTYELQWALARVDGTDLTLRDVQTYLIFDFS